MIRAAVSGLILLLLLLPCACLAQEEAAAIAPAAESALPDFGARIVPGESVVDLADFISTNMEASGTVPDLAQVQTADGELRTMSAAQVFVLLARTAYLWRATGGLPETVPITPDRLNPPVLDSEDVVLPPEDLDVGREIPTELFLDQCSAVVRWADRLQVIPTAVWVDGKRLSAAEYLAGMAICVSYAYWEGELSDTLFLPAYAPPTSWAKEVEAYYAEAEYAQGEQLVAGEEPLYEAADASEYGEEEPAESVEGYETVEAPLEELQGQEEELPAEEESWEGQGWGADWSAEGQGWQDDYGAGLGEEEEADEYEEESWEEEPAEGESEEEVWEEEYPEDFEESEEPEGSQYEIASKLTVIPEPGETVSGIVDVVASYSGPPSKFVIFTFDGKGEVMMNAPPYSSRWDTSKLEPGVHQIRVQVLGEEEQVLVDQTSAYTVVEASPKRRPEAGGS